MCTAGLALEPVEPGKDDDAMPDRRMVGRRDEVMNVDVDPDACPPTDAGRADLGEPGGNSRSHRSQAGPSTGGCGTSLTMLNLLVAVWLVVAPSVLGYADTWFGFGAQWNDIGIGVAIALVALVRTVEPFRGTVLAAMSFALGAWLAVAPFVLVAGTEARVAAAVWNDVVVGAVVTVLAFVSAACLRRDAPDPTIGNRPDGRLANRPTGALPHDRRTRDRPGSESAVRAEEPCADH